MQIKLRDVVSGKTLVKESKSIQISWTLYFSVTRQISTLNHVKKHHMRFWTQVQPHEHQYCPRSVKKVTV